MHLIQGIALVIGGLSVGWSLLLYRRSTDWRTLFLTLLLVVMTAQQALLYFSAGAAEPGSNSWHSGLPGLVASVMALLAIIFLNRVFAEKRAAENFLDASRRKYQTLFSAANDSIFIIDKETGRFLDANRKAQSMTGYRLEELQKMQVHDLDAATVRKKGVELFEEICRSGDLVFEHTLLRRDGREIPVEISTCFLEYDSRQVIQSIARDLTERRRAESAIRDIAAGVKSAIGDEFFRILAVRLAKSLNMDYALIGELVDEDAKRIRSVAYSYRGRILENLEYELPGTPCEKVVGSELCSFPREVQTLFPEDQVLAEMGIESYLGAPLLDSSGNPFGIISVFDTKELVNEGLARSMLQIFAVRASAELQRKQAAEALRDSEKRYRDLIENANDIIYSHDLKGNLLSLNRAGQEITGYSLEEAVGMNIADVTVPEKIKTTMQTTQKKLQDDCITTYETEILTKDKRRLSLEISSRLIEKSDGSRIVQGIGRDITERKKLEQQLRQSQKMEAIGQLAGGVAHDFNNIMTVILGYGSLLKEQIPEDSPATASLKAIQDAAERATSLTRQLLAFGRRQVLEPGEFDLNEIVEKVEKLLVRLLGADIQLRTDLQEQLFLARVDSSQIEQVIINLAVNARDAMPGGGVLTIRTRNLDLHPEGSLGRGLQPGQYVELSVVDTGHGMDETTRKHIFEPFFTTKPKGKGTGLGLATVYGIIKQSGGQILVQSRPEKGTAFRIYLQATPAPRAAPEGIQEKLSAGTATRGSETILVAEDEERIRELILRVLGSQGYHVLTAANGVEALSIFKSHPGAVSLLLADLVMPEMGGYELAEKLSALQPGLNVLFISGYSEDPALQPDLLQKRGAFLQKPFSPALLSTRIREILDRKSPVSRISAQLQSWHRRLDG